MSSSGSPRRRGPPGGFSLTELAVALVVFEVGVLGVLSLGVLAAREIARAADVQRAVGAAEVVADSLLRGGPGGEGSAEVGPHTVRWWSEEGLLRLEARRTGSTGDPLVGLDLPVEAVP